MAFWIDQRTIRLTNGIFYSTYSKRQSICMRQSRNRELYRWNEIILLANRNIFTYLSQSQFITDLHFNSNRQGLKSYSCFSRWLMAHKGSGALKQSPEILFGSSVLVCFVFAIDIIVFICSFCLTLLKHYIWSVV